ncbi:MAG TPA: F0F1 ATP synthase subunit A [Nevskiaceae bacterium]|nr:F0F1 ATP synthase subunit A [Nevskiaceae bacterium]
MAVENAEQVAEAAGNAEHALTPASYIGHHLSFLDKSVGSGGFWTLHLDTLAVSVLLGIVTLGFLRWVVSGATAGVPGKRQAFVEICVDFVNDQVKSLFHHDISFVAPLALTTVLWVVMMNAMDFLPVDIIGHGLQAVGLHEFRIVPTADVNMTFALALSVWLLMIGTAISVKGAGGFVHELFCTPFGVPKLSLNPFTWIGAVLMLAVNFLFQMIEYLSKPLSHSLRLFGNMYAGEIIFLLLWMWASTGLVGTVFGSLLGVGWIIFHILIVALQAYIFMMLTVVYISMAHESH